MTSEKAIKREREKEREKEKESEKERERESKVEEQRTHSLVLSRTVSLQVQAGNGIWKSQLLTKRDFRMNCRFG